MGSGHDGFYPARDAAARGERVMLVEQHRTIERGAGGDFRAEGVTYLTRATALGLYDDGYVTVLEHADELDRLWHVRARRVILATGAFERSIAFADNDRPGVMLSYAASLYLEHGVLVGSRTVVFTARGGAYGTASNLVANGGDVPAIADVSGTEPDLGLARDAEVLRGWVVSGTEGDRRLEAVHLEGPDGDRRTIECDSLLVSGGWDPNLALWRAIGGGLRFDDEVHAFVPTRGATVAVGRRVGGRRGAERRAVLVRPERGLLAALRRLPARPDDRGHRRHGRRGAALRRAREARHVHRHRDRSGPHERGHHRRGRERAPRRVARMAGTVERAAAVRCPVPFATLAGPFRGALFDPIRTTPMHPWHVERGAAFENVGQWKRPWFFPRDGEPMERAVERECLAVRNAVGAMDASTLGKIEVVGPDAPAFLDRMYTNRMSNLAVGSIRYGLMLGLDGMVLDDGVAMRLADDRYLVTTTTGGAATVLDRFEEWLQTEWPDLRVYCTSVTEQWAVVAINGPRAREVVSATGTDVDLSREAFPFMTFRDGQVAGVPARLARVSFSGELAYELHVPAWHGLEIWEAVMAAGAPFGIEPYGTEAMHVLRAEKGYVIVGQDTDGSVTPHDLGMDWIVNPSKGDFVGRRSLRRSDVVRPDRKQLVGLFPEDAHALLPEGAQLVLEDTGQIPMPLAGHVTSSYRSPALGRTFALAMLAGGHAMHGRTVYAPLPEGTVACTRHVARPLRPRRSTP